MPRPMPKTPRSSSNPAKILEGTSVFASIYHGAKLGYLVFLYYDQPH